MFTLYFLPKYRKQYISTHYILPEESPVNDTNHPCGIDNNVSYFTRPATEMKWLPNNILHTAGVVKKYILSRLNHVQLLFFILTQENRVQHLYGCTPHLKPVAYLRLLLPTEQARITYGKSDCCFKDFT